MWPDKNINNKKYIETHKLLNFERKKIKVETF
jgi:hypothetical protein